MHCYLREMFPLGRHLLLSVLAGLGIAGFVGTIQSAVRDEVVPAALGAAWNIFAMLLAFRLMDELKDRDIDRLLFPKRPLPSGRVRESDIRGTLVAVMALYLAANARSAPAFLSAVVVLAYAGLTFVRFFAPELLQRSLPITLATHTPMVPLLVLQVCVAAADRLGAPFRELRFTLILPYVAMIWMSILGWELARKIRAPEEETAYVTYSQVLGRAGAVTAAAVVQLLAVLSGAWLWMRLTLPCAFLAVLCIAWLLCAFAYARFLRRPSPATSRLKSFAAMFIFAVLLVQVVAFAGPR
jgi:4-hydroxybenzoate polyprenyltransferase